MKIKYFKIIIYTVLFLVFVNLYGQGGSNYSILGIGDINYSGYSSYSALSGTQIAFPAEYSINNRNPAMWSFVSNTRLQTGYKFNQNIVSADNSTVWHNNGAISGFAGIFAIDSANGISASFGIVPYSNINYLTATTKDVKEMGLDLKATTTYQGTGGLSQAYAGVSTKITEWLGVGASVYATFGVVQSSRETKFTGDYYAFTYTATKSDYVSGWGTKTGLFLKPANQWILGLSYEAQPQLSVNNEINFHSSASNVDTIVKAETNYTVPGLFGIGASYSTGNFIFGADFSTQDFSSFDYNKGANSEFTNSYIISAGANRIGNPSINAPFADRVSYKFGVGYNQLYYKVLGNQIKEMTASVGMQMPFTGSLIIDLSFIFGQRTSGDSRLVSEYFGKLGVDISIGETWFVPFKREY